MVRFALPNARYASAAFAFVLFLGGTPPSPAQVARAGAAAAPAPQEKAPDELARLIGAAAATSSLRIKLDRNARTQLRHFVVHPSGRADIRASLRRFETHRAFYERLAAEAGVPRELLAIPIIESRYRSLPEARNFKHCCAGLWQLDRNTARHYGLRVDKRIDERLYVDKSTRVALRHLADLRAQFGDWGLAITAYNVGPSFLRRAIRTHGTDDAWQLSRLGATGRFLSRVTAALIVFQDHAPRNLAPGSPSPLMDLPSPAQPPLELAATQRFLTLADLLPPPMAKRLEL
jgi:soluble lytic murein transglycosylase-like protein